ncbi:MAG: hypothetical protein P0Y53_18260 [Candidatus Pseudobacter hemicellulosilyticus]|uniref:Outer membrane protein with beta-barrel domain n=1 Tax=Candidatus Pseudobacter hemicellulosilyticus TaxID=3121375 RepID=A0AAJ5WNL9_9BACT|nr:MAG: hypothetical protein P0Y53_18260 [Pseudobacter sp.]
MKKIVALLLIGTIATTAWAQNNPRPKSPTAKQDQKAAKRERINALLKLEEEGEIIFSKQSVFGIKINSDGYGISYEMGRFKSPRIATIYGIELNEKKHNKEKRFSWSDGGFSSNTVIFGKMNNFYQLKLSAGQQRIIGGKGNKNGVAVMAIYTGGLSAGMVKPYYVKVSKTQQGGELFKSTYPTIIDSNYFIAGASGFTVGWGDVKIRPGAHAKAALRFDWGRFNETVTAIEAGLNVEYYANKIPQMAYQKEKNLFFNAYVSFLFGRRKS